MQCQVLLVNDVETGIRVTVAYGYLHRMRGLIGKDVVDDKALLIPQCSSIHTWFMRGAIDAVFIDNNNIVKKVVPSLQPWRMIWPVSGAKRVLELGAGVSKKVNIRTGDRITLR